MAFFDKVGEFAKNAADKVGEFAQTTADKAGDSIEISKINGKIRAEEGRISELKFKIGDYYYSKYTSGEAAEGGVADLMKEIDSAFSAINDFNAQIQSIKNSGGQPQAAGQQPVQPQAQSQPQPQAGAVCTSCGAAMAPEVKFCPVCGEKRA